MQQFIYSSLLFIVICMIASCTPTQGEDLSPVEENFWQPMAKSDAVEVILMNTEGERTGIATLQQEDEGVVIALEAWDLPEGTHGFHIHEKGLCQTPTFSSAGDHFNPTKAKHGFDHPEGPHAGDLANIEVDEDGTSKEVVVADMVTLKEGEAHSLFQDDGVALIIHSDADDYTSQPAGDAGDRIACGVIEQ